ncbi:L-type lectin receptor kinase IX.1 [Hibiscus trionum]|uniref:non-specific serine/threonine protein kinase n=1 Tax=Hibiscus trionum TaxID=183268 RepID=A0A9W7MGL9_HIBTR|nr:L-type lectin receptor kinase IX.1 [Hibiscus trionum]
MMKAENLCAFLFISSILVVSKAASTDDGSSINFTFTGFNTSTPGPGIVYEADAYPSGNAIQLTLNQIHKGLNDSVGRATYYKPMHLWDNSSGNPVVADFTTHFSFSVDSLNKTSGDRGDGFAFFLAPDGSKLPPNSAGGCLGLQICDSDANTKFVAVEFDTYRNKLWDPKEMPEHVAIDLNTVKASINPVEWWWNDIANGGKVDAFITYNSSTKNLSVFFHDADYRNSSSLSATLDLSQFLPEWVTFGFSGTTGASIELHSIYSWSFSSSLQIANPMNTTINPPISAPPAPTRKSKTWLLWVVLAIAGGISALLPVLGLLWIVCRMRKEGTISVNLEREMVTVPRNFSYTELGVATSNFADEGLLGEGGFGKVYLGFLRDINCNIAVKRITPNSQQGVKEYESEVITISRLRHRNLVQLIGWCQDDKEFLIVYEFLPNKSLDYHLHTEPCSLTWDKRYKIAMGLASALFYLQEECDQCVLHRDIKSSNVLLDLGFNAKLGDFGLARLVEHGQGSRTTKVMLGTDGYIAPECLNTYRTVKESDIYSFGIVALEIASGKQAIAVIERDGKKFKTKLVEWVWELYGKDSLLDAADPRLYDNYDGEQMERLLLVGLACAHPDYFARPSITLAIEILGFKAPPPMLPPEMPVPTYVAALQDNIAASSASHTGGSSRSQTQSSGSGSGIHSLKGKERTVG